MLQIRNIQVTGEFIRVILDSKFKKCIVQCGSCQQKGPSFWTNHVINYLLNVGTNLKEKKIGTSDTGFILLQVE